MIVKLEHSDMADVFRAAKEDIGAYLAGVDVVKKIARLPWGCAPGSYVERILEGIAEYYEQKMKYENTKEK